ncbi:MAG: SLC13 family permease [Bacteroidota bacterium]
MKIQLIKLLLGPALFLLIYLTGPYPGMSDQALAVLASTSWVAIWWVTEAIPIAATSLLPIVLFPLTQGLSISQTTGSYGHRFVFLYIGGFMIAMAIEKWNLHRRIALNVIRLIGTSPDKMVLGFMVATAFLSMWISNTATTVMMLPIGMAIVVQFSELIDKTKIEGFSKALMLGIAYSASIGGISTLIGTPPNLVFAGTIEKFYDFEVSFLSWFMLVFPLSVVVLLICWKYLTNYAFKIKEPGLDGATEEIDRQLKKLGNITREEKIVLIVFAFTGLCWISRPFLIEPFLPQVDDTIIGITGAMILFLIPAREGSILSWEHAVKLPWGIVLLFGGGMAIASGFQESGLAEWIGSRMTGLEGLSVLVILVIIVFMVNFLTEITSNLATTAMLLPALAPTALSLDIHPFLLMIGATIAASCAFMLPVATPPNAVVFGSGYLSISDMFRKGFVMNIISVILVSIYLYFMLPLLWGIDFSVFPTQWK